MTPDEKGDAGWLRGQTTRRRYHRRSDGGPERRQRCPDGGPEHRYEWYTADPLYVSRPDDNQISGRHSGHTATAARRRLRDQVECLCPALSPKVNTTRMHSNAFRVG